MSTRSRIGIVNEDGTVRSIYCHFDGYPEGVGQTLLDNYTDVDKINNLLDLGDISCLGSEPVSDSKYWDPFSAITASDYTLAYKDRGEDCPAVVDKNEDAFYSWNEEYMYLYYPERNQWRVNDRYWLDELL